MIKLETYTPPNMDSIKVIKKWATNIAGEWNGDESGQQEDRANCAGEILEKAEELEKLISEMDEI
jgi:hypothetical protein